jgi:hypothetical protein
MSGYRGLFAKHIHLPALIALLLAVAALAPASASAAAPPQLAQFCETGNGAGQCRVPTGIATDPSTGDIYVSDGRNNRINVFSVWGTFVKAWGWGVLDGKSELQTCTTQTGCQEGLEGAGNGQFGLIRGLAVDGEGDVYAVDWGNWRVQKFDPDGGAGGAAELLLMFGGEVNKTKSDEVGTTPAERNLCTAASGDVCRAGSLGSGPGQFEVWPVASSYVAVAPNDDVYVGDVGRIQRFDEEGHYLESIALPGERVHSLAIDRSGGPNNGDLYAALCMNGCVRSGNIPGSKPNVRRLAPSGPTATVEATLAVAEPTALVVDADGNVYGVDGIKEGPEELKIHKFSPGGTEAAGFPFSDGLDQSVAIATNSVCGIAGTDLYVANFSVNSYVRAYGAPPNAAICPPPSVPPRITAQYATAVDTTGATLKAAISPEFFSDTTYYVEYGVGKCSEGGCDQEKPLPPGSKLTSLTTNKALTTTGVFLGGLEPGTTYHYRFVAQSSGGGPVRGVGGKEGIDGKEGTFITFPSPVAKTDCANQAFRSGDAAKLPECRAYEMVSPVDKNGGNVITGPIISAYKPVPRSSADGERFTFSSLSSFAGPSSSPIVSQYLSNRGTGGWSTQSISLPRGVFSLYPVAFSGTYKAFDESLCDAWALQTSDLAVTADAPPGVINMYHRDNCGGGGYEVLSDVIPPGIGGPGGILPEYSSPLIGGFSADRSHVVFRVAAQLTKNGCKTAGIYQVYETASEGEMRLISILPNGQATCSHSSPGTYMGSPDTSSESSFSHAVSDDGSTVFWTDSGEFTLNDNNSGEGPGRLYVRLRATEAPSKPGSGCSEAEKACTLPIYTAGIGSNGAFFWGATADGGKAIYGVKGGSEELFEYDVADEASTLIAKGSGGVAGISDDASRVYFVSSEVLTASPNSQGDLAEEGERNLYLYEPGQGGGAYTFIGALSGLDGGVTSAGANGRSARVSPDGAHLAFEASTSLTGYDNSRLGGDDEPTSQLYIYDAEEGGPGQLTCVSCNPSGARPAGRAIGAGGIGFESATLPGWPEQLRPSRLLTEDGDTLFFQSVDALLPADSNGMRDVYEWQRADGPEACKEAGAQLYVPSANGCLSLISSGQSPEDSEVLEASKGAKDIFFITRSSLLPQDLDLFDVYDARVNGGFPQPPPTPAICEGEACQGVPTAPNDPTPASSAFEGSGNVSEKAAKKKAKKAHKHKKKKAHKKAKKANKSGRAGR